MFSRPLSQLKDKSGKLGYVNPLPIYVEWSLLRLSLNRSISSRMGVWLLLILTCFIKNHVFNANCVDPDQTPRSAAPDLGLLFAKVPLKERWV